MKKLLTIFWLFYSNTFAQENEGKNEFLVQIKNHKFTPDTIKVNANQPFKLTIENLDNTLEEFESDDLKKEKLVGANKKIIINVQALKAGEYKFYGDFHQKTAQGKIIVK
jgi:plastocyanin